MNETSRPALVQPMAVTNRANSRDRLMEQVIDNTRQGFDVDAFHVMDRRDNSLIEDEILNGSQSSKFLYVMEGMKGEDGKPVSGVSVIGARHLAATYGGLKHRIVASMRKVGPLVINTSYPQPGVPMATSIQRIPEIESDPDSYTVIMEVTDIKTGNSQMHEKTEERYGRRRDGSTFERPNYQIIAQSKCFRNSTLAVVPQDILIRWKADLLKLDKHKDIITDGVRDEKLSGILQFAAAKAIPIDRHKVEELTMDQISGLREAAQGGQPAFVNAAKALGLIVPDDQPQQTTPEPEKPRASTKRADKAACNAPATQPQEPPPSDPGDPGPQELFA